MSRAGFSRLNAVAVIAAAALAAGLVFFILESRDSGDGDLDPGDGANPPTSGPSPVSDSGTVEPPTDSESPFMPIKDGPPGTGTPVKKTLSAIVTAGDGKELDSIRAILKERSGTGAFDGWLRPSAGGKISIGAVPGSYELRIEAFGYAAETLAVTESSFDGVPLRVVLSPDSRPCGITILLKNGDGGVVSEGRLVLRPKKGGEAVVLESRPDGVRAGSGLRAGEYYIEFAPPNAGGEVKISNVVLDPGSSKDFTFTVSLMSVSGTVFDKEDGRPVPGAEVFFFDERSESRDQGLPVPVVADGSGSFEARFLPAGPYLVAARARGYALAVEIASSVPDAATRIEISLQRSQWLELDIASAEGAQPERMFIQGKGRNMKVPRLPVQRNAAGVPFLDLTAGEWRLVLSCPGFEDVDLRLRPGDFDAGKVRIELEASKK